MENAEFFSIIMLHIIKTNQISIPKTKAELKAYVSQCQYIESN